MSVASVVLLVLRLKAILGGILVIFLLGMPLVMLVLCLYLLVLYVRLLTSLSGEISRQTRR